MSHKANVAVLLLLLCVGQLYAAQPSVTLGSSVIYGVSTQVGPTRVDKYLGIRFAQPPTGDLRFKKPEPATLDAMVNATSHGNSCLNAIQLPRMDEDCLFLDVYVPYNSEGTGVRLPVVMWIYGGGFVLGTNAMYNGDLLAAEGNVILVAPNYRLGAFGFLSTGDNSSRGNFGLWDQWLALKWTRDNIGQFGGDVNRITLIGESAGAASVNFLMTSPYTANWFHRAILQSGSRLCPWAYNSSYSPLDKANRLANLTGCPSATQEDTDTTAALVACLREKPAGDIHQTYLRGLSGWTPVIDGDFVLPYSDAPKFGGSVMAGLNNREGGLGVKTRKDLRIPVNNRKYYHEHRLMPLLRGVHYNLMTSADPCDVRKVVEYVDDMYKVEGLSNDSYVPDEELEAVAADAEFFVCNKQLFDSDPSTGNAYLYYFDHYPENPNGKKGMDHAMDLDYTFGVGNGHTIFPDYNITRNDLNLAENFRSILTNFAKTRNPYQPNPLPDKWPSWPPYKKGEESYMSVSFSPALCYQLRKNRMSFWIDTVPSLLKSQGPLHFNKTRFHRCVQPTGAAGFTYVTKTIFILLFVALISF